MHCHQGRVISNTDRIEPPHRTVGQVNILIFATVSRVVHRVVQAEAMAIFNRVGSIDIKHYSKYVI